ncbi:hypothetical protein [Bowmanella denitrificans]|uniref:hypothetical protein n=1 Tax=Bowmanella denitrificans TaxID=366582 RepID=UPI000C9AC711|nr:hypothetical protein [Bowmanella denitrificans]
MNQRFVVAMMAACGVVTYPVANAAGTLDYLKVDGTVVQFSTTEPKPAIPSLACVADNMAQNWSVSLSNESGRAIYSLIVTAMSKELALDIVSAGDCGDKDGLERAGEVSIASLAVDNSKTAVEWAGYTDATPGNFARRVNTQPIKGAVLAATQVCHAKYPGARVMLWDDYVALGPQYPSTESIWFIDAVQNVNFAMAQGSQSGSISAHSNIFYKNGQVSQFNNDRGHGSIYNRKEFTRYASCSEWGDGTSVSSGTVLTSLGRFGSDSCQNAQKIACVK